MLTYPLIGQGHSKLIKFPQDLRHLSGTRILASSVQSITDQKERQKREERGMEGNRYQTGFWCEMWRWHWRPEAARKDWSCLLLPSRLYMINCPFLWAQHLFNPENRQAKPSFKGLAYFWPVFHGISDVNISSHMITLTHTHIEVTGQFSTADITWYSAALDSCWFACWTCTSAFSTLASMLSLE